MNANELADELYDLDVQASQQSLNDWAEQAATMLRQQQAELANLKAGLLSHHDIYPVKEQLTDEEIKEAMEFAGIRPSKEWGLATTGNVQLMIFAKAILRKAQEK